ncbi:MAG: type II toxin-antitoxin system VapC family toxin [Betaproteobacteria bacterium]|nr:type II toxin-antitoxin system VapC family toxin [Betaproteobacteria bacterium]
MFVLDTNICVFVLNRRPGFERIIRRMDGLSRGEVLLSSVTAAELQIGAWASKRKQDNLLRLERFLAEFDVVPFDENAARAYGRLRAALKELGTPIGPLDTLIAGHVLAIGATLVTNNLREFQRVPGLVSQDWS